MHATALEPRVAPALRDAEVLGALIGAVDDRTDVAPLDAAQVLARGRAALELELAQLLAAADA